MDNNGQPMTDDAELAKVLEGMQDAATTEPVAPALSFDPSAPVAADPNALPPAVVPAEPASLPAPDMTAAPVAPAPAYAPNADPGLESIKKEALEQLRPLVDKLNLPADEKFDTLLLIIRSTDDRSLVQSAYSAAASITDDAKRAEAMLDIIKEIDYFNNPAAGQPQL